MKFLDDLRNLDRNNVGGWSKSVKVFFMVLLFCAVILAGWYFKVSNQQDDLATAAQQETKLKREFAQKQAKAVNLHALEKQLADMKDMLHQLLRQLPSKTEMPQLLVDISQTALAAGIDTEVFQVEGENTKDFYAEQPIGLKMVGTYHQFGTFISDVASLPRVVILTMHNVSLTPLNGSSKGNMTDGRLLVLQGTVKTYRYLDDDIDGNAKGKGGK
ncbi:MAG TPA: type 4a pilus biogenesis protein PilO [Rhodanobacteraceae bacterium]|nr:type 4a pilus biogenesis protein PilO [Rhodanobacteraceae bacterium]